MRTLLISTLLFAMGARLPAITTSYSMPPEDLDGSGHDLESSGSGSGEWTEVSEDSVSFTTMSEEDFMFNAIDEEDTTVPIIMTDNTRNKIPEDSDLTFDIRPKLGDDDNGSAIGNVAKSGGLLANKEALAAIIAGGMVGLVLAASLLSLMVYNMKKKDVSQKNTLNGGYQEPKTKEEFIQ